MMKDFSWKSPENAASSITEYPQREGNLGYNREDILILLEATAVTEKIVGKNLSTLGTHLHHPSAGLLAKYSDFQFSVVHLAQKLSS